METAAVRLSLGGKHGADQLITTDVADPGQCEEEAETDYCDEPRLIQCLQVMLIHPSFPCSPIWLPTLARQFR
jgi:hypothetical protein